jgi:sugar O-acyltransferase (sialic acid O-acetyltransferase NeuD family)
MTKPHVLIIGAGGHAKVVIATLQAGGRTVDGILDDRRSLQGTSILGVPVIGTTERASTFRHLDAIVAVGDNEIRRALVERLNLEWTVAIHPASIIHPDVTIGAGTVVFAGAVIQPGAWVGAHVIINTSASIDHDCQIGAFCHVAPGAHLGGTVVVAEGAFVGIAAVVLPNIKIEEWAQLGGGAVAIRNVGARCVAVGIPAIAMPRTPGSTNGTQRRGVKLLRAEPQSTFIGPTDPRWVDVLSRTVHDAYHLPEYLAICAKHEGAESLAFYSENSGRLCLIPLLLRHLPEHLGAPSFWCDLVSPYGYACPIYTHPTEGQQVSAFLNAFRTAADELGACSAFLRLHPLLEPQSHPELRLSMCVNHGETVSIDLTVSEEEMWRQTRDGHRSDIRRLQKLNFVAVMDDWDLYGEFIRMYRDTMLRRRAEPFYCFPDEYFADLKSALAHRLHFCCVLAPDGRLAAGGLFTAVNQIMEYHLSGSNTRYHRLAPTKLMLHFIRLWAKENGYSVLHLGGGTGAQSDSLFQFKAGFSLDRSQYKTYRLVTNEHRYTALSLRAGRTLTLPADLEAEFFPVYRQSSDTVTQNEPHSVLRSQVGPAGRSSPGTV